MDAGCRAGERAWPHSPNISAACISFMTDVSFGVFAPQSLNSSKKLTRFLEISRGRIKSVVVAVKPHYRLGVTFHKGSVCEASVIALSEKVENRTAEKL